MQLFSSGEATRGTANERLVAITKVKTRESRLELHG